MIAEAIFNSKIRYGISVYLNPVFDNEDLKAKKLSKNASTLQTLQNAMLRLIFGFQIKQRVNMQRLRETSLKILSACKRDKRLTTLLIQQHSKRCASFMQTLCKHHANALQKLSKCCTNAM